MRVAPYQAGEPADLLCVPVFEGEAPFSAAFPGFSGILDQAGRFPKDPGKKGSIRVVPVRDASVKALLLAGLGKRPASASATATVYRNRMAECVRHAISLGFVSVTALLPDAPDFHISRSVAEGAVLGNYVFRAYWTTDSHPEKTDIETFTLVGADPDGLDRGVLFGGAQAFARDLVNEPGNVINPLTLADRAIALAKENDLECTVFDENDIRKMGMNALLSVGQGSRTPPRLIHLVYRPEAPSSRRVALVGKTVTFDSGGLCIKTRDGIKTMKTDKTGGCNVLAIMRALGKLRPDVEVHGILGAVENMPDGNSYRPDDIIRTMSGKTIVTNAPEVRRCQSWPREPIIFKSACVKTAMSGLVPRKTIATNKSFQTQRNWKMANEATAGIESGRIRCVKIVKCDAPSKKADSKMSFGNWLM